MSQSTEPIAEQGIYESDLNNLVTLKHDVIQNQGMMSKDAEPIVIDSYHNFILWTHRTKDIKYIEQIKLKVLNKIRDSMSFVRSISEFKRSKPIDCDIADFFRIFGKFRRHFYLSGKKPKNVDKYHIKSLDECEFESVFGCKAESITKSNEKKGQRCTLQFPLIVMYNEIEGSILLDVKYSIIDTTTGNSILNYKISTSQDRSTKIVKSLMGQCNGPTVNGQTNKPITASQMISNALLADKITGAWGSL